VKQDHSLKLFVHPWGKVPWSFQNASLVLAH